MKYPYKINIWLKSASLRNIIDSIEDKYQVDRSSLSKILS